MTRSFYSLNSLFDLFSQDFDRALCEVRDSNVFGTGFPPYNVKMDEVSQDLRFEFALAGYTKDNVELSFDGDYMLLSITADKEVNDKFKFVSHGIKSGNAKLKVAVPFSKFEQEQAKASFNDGILIVDIPRKEELKPKRLLIE